MRTQHTRARFRERRARERNDGGGFAWVLCGGMSPGEPARVGLVVRAEGGKGRGVVLCLTAHARSPFSHPIGVCIRRTIAVCFPSYSLFLPQKTKHVKNVLEEKTVVVNAAGGRERRGFGLMRDRSPLFRLRRTQESAVASGTFMEEGGRAGGREQVY